MEYLVLLCTQNFKQFKPFKGLHEKKKQTMPVNWPYCFMSIDILLEMYNLICYRVI